MREIKSTEVLNYLTAKTPDELRELMLQNNLIKGKYFNYQEIRQDNKGHWICWYLEEVDVELEKELGVFDERNKTRKRIR